MYNICRYICFSKNKIKKFKICVDKKVNIVYIKSGLYWSGSKKGATVKGIIIIIVLTLIAAVYDARQSRIPNYLIISGLIIWTIWMIHDSSSYRDCILGLIIPLFALFPFYIIRGLGAGDVKLLSVCGGFIGVSELGKYLVTVLAVSFLYGVITGLIKHKKILNRNLIPMAVPIFMGTVIYVIFHSNLI